MPLADLGTRSLYYERRGSGEPLLLIQGMAGHHNTWGEPFKSLLDPYFEVVAFDHRGIGDSSDVPGQFSIAELADDAAAVLDAVGWPSAHVLGISMGGMTAQEFVLNHPGRVRRLALGCTYAGGVGSSLVAPGALMMFEAGASGDLDKAIRAGYEANLSPAFRSDESRFEPFRDANLSVRVPIEVVLRQAQAAFVHDTSTRLPSVAAPTLVLHGTEDQMILYSNGLHVASLIPGARLHTFDGVGHLFFWEEPDRTAALLREHFLG